MGIRAQDQGTPPQITDTLLHVNVVDADDQNPKFLDDRYNAFLPEPPTQVCYFLKDPAKMFMEMGSLSNVRIAESSLGPQKIA